MVEYCRKLMLNIAYCVGGTFCNAITQAKNKYWVFFWLLIEVQVQTNRRFTRINALKQRNDMYHSYNKPIIGTFTAT